MGTLLSLILHAILWLIVIYLLFNVVRKVVEEKNPLIDSITGMVKVLIEKIKKCYGIVRQRICKKSNEINDDSGTVYNGPEFYDSSSEWGD